VYCDDSVKKVVAFGDWHANYRWAVPALKRFSSAEKKPDAYLHVGDFGVWSWSGIFLSMVEYQLAEQGRELWLVDGNHEDFNLLKTFPYDDRGLQIIRPHIFRIPRGYSWEWAGKKFVGLGGAFSVDRKRRTPEVSWFLDETITEDDFQKTVENKSADILISHDAPWLPFQFLSEGSSPPKIKLTPEEIRYSEEGRDYIARALNELKPKLHLHGHHHVAYVKNYFETQVIGLDCDKRSFDENAVEIYLDEL
jgi:hypothetical protein